MILNQSNVRQRRPLRAGLLIVIGLVAALATQMNLPSGMAGVVKGSKGPVFDIVPDNALSTLTVASPKGATFYMQGTIYQFRTINQADCTPLFTGKDLTDRELGTWRAWGTVGDNGRLVLHQTLTFDRPETTPLNSSIEVQ